ncbi:hypothetical protein HYW53_01215 [Candidatus Giovannonibacteria bacterium]|nr:hypothetical protein [Candidatus Giovannonibacteria bacterium]
MRNKYLYISLLILVLFLAPFVNALAQTAGGTITQKTSGSVQEKDFLGWARFLFPLGLSAAAILAVLMIVIGGIQMMGSFGNVALRTQAKEKIYSALFGLAIAVLSFLILYTINPQLLKMQISVPALQITELNKFESGGNVEQYQTGGPEAKICTGDTCQDVKYNCLAVYKGGYNPVVAGPYIGVNGRKECLVKCTDEFVSRVRNVKVSGLVRGSCEAAQ